MMCRVEKAFGSGCRDLMAVLEYEILVLENVDVFEFMSKNKNLTHALRKQMIECINAKYQSGNVKDEKLVRKMIKEMVQQLNALYDVNLSHCLWLCDEKHVRTLYGKQEDKIDFYEESHIVLSDLGVCGKLYAYSSNPQPIS